MNIMPAAAGPDELLWGGYSENVREVTGLGDTDPREMAASIIRLLMGFLGILAVALILMAGFKWMTSAGDEEKIGQAKGMLQGSVIGLVIILSSFGLAQFFLSAMHSATGAVG